MRAFSRLFAAIKPGQFLEAGTPTGLTGLNTHPSPRSTLIYLYSSTLDKLHQMPESSVYRQSAEALTKHRLSIIESIKPPGWDAWEQHIHYQVQENMDAFKISPTSRGTKINTIKPREVDPRTKSSEWDGELGGPVGEGIRSLKDRKPLTSKISGPHDYNIDRVFKEVKLAPEPQLTAEQISDLENRIGAGLIEEVIQVAEGEEKLAGEMVKAKVWEELEEPVPEGQWKYFERGGHTKTQAP